MNYPVWELEGSGLLIAIISIVHVFVSHFAVGGGLFLVLAEQGLHENGGVAQVGRHAHLGDADQVRLQHVVMDVAALEQLAQHVAHLLADAKQADRAAFGSFLATH